MGDRELALDREAAEEIRAARVDLEAALDEVERLHRDHRRVESLLHGLLDLLPLAVVVVDRDLRVCALSAAGEAAWADRIGRPVTHDEGDFRAALDGLEPRRSAGGLELARFDEPGTGDRYVVAWRPG